MPRDTPLFSFSLISFLFLFPQLLHLLMVAFLLASRLFAARGGGGRGKQKRLVVSFAHENIERQECRFWHAVRVCEVPLYECIFAPPCCFAGEQKMTVVVDMHFKGDAYPWSSGCFFSLSSHS
ncbi:hypothetical protein V8C26DRAFT_404320 [Trichoderma gracile]